MNIFGANEEKNNFYRRLLTIAIPIIIQQVVAISLNLIDTLMIGFVGEAELAAVGAANQMFGIYVVTCYGLYSGATVFTAQYWGVRDIKNIRKVLGIEYLTGAVLSLIFVAIAIFFPSRIISVFSRDPHVIAVGAEYLRTICPSYFLFAFSFAITFNSRAIQKLKVATAVNASALAVNTFLNYCLIFGKFGFPELGVRGAAVATVIARLIELLALLIYIYNSKDHPFRAKFRELINYDFATFSSTMRTVMPVVINESAWSVATAGIFAIYGIIGVSALAVIQVANVVGQMFMAAYFGIGNASLVLIGEALGRKEIERAHDYSKMVLKTSWVISFILAVILFLTSKPIAGIYDFSPETTEILVLTIKAWSLALIPKAMSYIYICGILRAGGDTFYCMIVEIVINLLIKILLALAAVVLLNFPIYLALLIVSIGDALEVFITYRRYRSKKWAKTVI